MTMKKRLIVNADDLGRTRGINRGVFEAHAAGVVTSATMMVNYEAARNVPELSRAHPGLGIGLHVALTGGASALPAAQIPSLCDGSGRLAAKPEGLAALGPAPGEVLAEARAQLQLFQTIMGRLPTHFDSHHHSHELPVVFEAVVTLARECERPVRNTGPEMAERLRAHGVRTTDRFVASFFGGTANVDTLEDVLYSLEAGTTELMCHPAHVDEELRSSSGYAEPRDAERKALQDIRVRSMMRALGVERINFEAL